MVAWVALMAGTTGVSHPFSYGMPQAAVAPQVMRSGAIDAGEEFRGQVFICDLGGRLGTTLLAGRVDQANSVWD